MFKLILCFIDTRIVDTISYTPGVDSVDLQILCIPQGNPDLASIRWTNGSGVYFPNPANLSEIERVFSTVDVVALLCVDIAFPSDTLVEIQLFLPGTLQIEFIFRSHLLAFYSFRRAEYYPLIFWESYSSNWKNRKH